MTSGSGPRGWTPLIPPSVMAESGTTAATIPKPQGYFPGRGNLTCQPGSSLSRRGLSFELLGALSQRREGPRAILGVALERRQRLQAPCAHTGARPTGFLVAQSSLTEAARGVAVQVGAGGRRGKCSKTFQFYPFRESLELFALLSLHVPTSKPTCSESELACRGLSPAGGHSHVRTTGSAEAQHIGFPRSSETLSVCCNFIRTS